MRIHFVASGYVVSLGASMFFNAVALMLAAFTAAQVIDNCLILVPNIPPGIGPFCQNCEDGFLNTGEECIPCSTEDCKVCQPPTGDLCTQCIHPYTLVDGECDFLICIGGELVSAEPVINAANPCGENCKICPEENEPFCQECEIGHWNDNGYCKPCCTEGCRVCQPPSGFVCTQCLESNLPAIEGVCEPLK